MHARVHVYQYVFVLACLHMYMCVIGLLMEFFKILNIFYIDIKLKLSAAKNMKAILEHMKSVAS